MTLSRRVSHPLTAAILAMSCFGAQAASHREAPLIAQDPTADITDVYAFVSYDEENLVRPPENRRVTLIMNVIPGQNPADGPNYFYFADDVVYRLHVDNNTNGKAEDVVYEFRFKTETRPLDGPLDLPLALVALPEITALDGPGSQGIYRRQTFSVTEVRNDARYKLFPGQKLVAVPSNLGSRTIPDYDALAAQGVYSGACGDGTDGVRVYAGQRAETFYIDLDATFDTLNFRSSPLLTVAQDANDNANPFGINRFANANINTIAIEVPIKCLTRDRKPVQSKNAKNALIGVYASTSRPKLRVLRDRGETINAGPDVQVARLANPLVNELIINTPSKDFWNQQEPKDEAQFQDFYRMPVIAAALKIVFGVDVPSTPRTDLMSTLLKYPGQPVNGTNCGSPCSDLLRLNLGVAPVAAEKQRRLGPFAHDDQNNPTPDLAGWPNGRRPNDDVTDIAVRVVGGDNYINGRAGDGVNAFLEAPGIGTSDGPGLRLDVTGNGIAKEFPFLPTPFSGRN